MHTDETEQVSLPPLITTKQKNTEHGRTILEQQQATTKVRNSSKSSKMIAKSQIITTFKNHLAILADANSLDSCVEEIEIAL